MNRHFRFLIAAAVLNAFACDSGDPAEEGSAPLAPRDLVVTPLDGGAHLVWVDDSDDEEEFVIERADAGAEFEEISAVPFDTTVYHDATLMPGIEYKFRIMARNGDGDSAYTAEQSVTVME